MAKTSRAERAAAKAPNTTAPVSEDFAAKVAAGVAAGVHGVDGAVYKLALQRLTVQLIVVGHDPRLSPIDQELELSATIALLQELQPRGMTEGILATEMIAFHDSIMDCLQRAREPREEPTARDMYFRLAAKLASVLARHVEVLEKHREITVEWKSVPKPS